ncbi:MAG TPA: cytochrome P450 [Pseudomonadales bacterium]|nr:cytochrome P450 [Pseudomonadales bacterium]
MSEETAAPEVPTSIFQLTAFDPEARVDPHPRMRALREHGRAMRDEAARVWILSHYDDIRTSVNDTSFWRGPDRAEEGSIPRRQADAGDSGQGVSILQMDDPDHARNRRPLMQAFYARIKKMAPEIEALIDEVIEAAPASGRFDLMEHIAVPIPIRVIAHILGVDETRLGEFREWSEGLIHFLNPLRTPEQTAWMTECGEKLDAYFGDLMDARRAAPCEDLISDMVQAQAAGGDFSDEELRINLRALLVAGNLTTTDLIGNGVWLFLTHPDQLEAFRANPKLDVPAVEEVLRYEAPVQVTSRIVSEDREVAGCPMSRSQPIFMSLAAANRDPDSFDDPETFDITVKRRSHVSFGGGAHICIGAPLARIEARRVYRKLFERYPQMQLPAQDIVWRALPFFRGIEKLEIEV